MICHTPWLIVIIPTIIYIALYKSIYKKSSHFMHFAVPDRNALQYETSGICDADIRPAQYSRVYTSTFFKRAETRVFLYRSKLAGFAHSLSYRKHSQNTNQTHPFVNRSYPKSLEKTAVPIRSVRLFCRCSQIQVFRHTPQKHLRRYSSIGLIS